MEIIVLCDQGYISVYAGFRLINVSALSDARFHKEAESGVVLCARSIKPFERSRPWLRRTRALWELNGWEERCGGGLDLRSGAQLAAGEQQWSLERQVC